MDNHHKDSEPISTRKPMTPAQAKYMKGLAQHAGEPFDPNLTAGEASKRIEKLQVKTGRKPKVILKDEQSTG